MKIVVLTIPSTKADETLIERCYNCGTTKSKQWYSPHHIAMKHGYHYCESCFKRLYPKGDNFCGLRKERR